jgi:hypothetical protein
MVSTQSEKYYLKEKDWKAKLIAHVMVTQIMAFQWLQFDAG